MKEQEYQQEIEMRNRECKQCKQEYERKGINFSPSACRYCENGQRLHELYLKTSEREQEWG